MRGYADFVSEALTPRVFRAVTRVLELVQGRSLSLDAAFQEVSLNFSLAPAEQRAVYLLAKDVLYNFGPAVYVLEKHRKTGLPLRRRAAFLVAFYLARLAPGMHAKVKAVRGGLLGDALLSLLSERSIEMVLAEIQGLQTPKRIAYEESVPPLLVESLLTRFGEKETLRLLRATRHRHVWIRVNDPNRTRDVEEYLREKGLKVKVDSDVEYLLELEAPQDSPLPQLPQNLAVYQDKASVVAVEALLSASPGEPLVDLAAAPCMKASLFCFRRHRGEVILVDISEKRMGSCRSIMHGAPCMHEIVVSDGRIFSARGGAGAVIVDAPCTNSGSLAKDPGLRLSLWNLTHADLEKYTSLQTALLRNALKLAKRGAPILYSTCSLLKEEGEDVLLGLGTDYRFLKPELPPSLEKTILRTCNGCYRLLPHLHKTDGFFFALLTKP